MIYRLAVVSPEPVHVSSTLCSDDNKYHIIVKDEAHWQICRTTSALFQVSRAIRSMSMALFKENEFVVGSFDLMSTEFWTRSPSVFRDSMSHMTISGLNSGEDCLYTSRWLDDFRNLRHLKLQCGYGPWGFTKGCFHSRRCWNKRFLRLPALKVIELECYAGESTRWKDVPCEDIVDFQGSRFVDVVNGLRVSFRSLKKDEEESMLPSVSRVKVGYAADGSASAWKSEILRQPRACLTSSRSPWVRFVPLSMLKPKHTNKFSNTKMDPWMTS